MARIVRTVLAFLLLYSPLALAGETAEIPVIPIMKRETWFRDLWYVRLAGGWAVEQTLVEITVGGSVRVEQDEPGIINLQVGRPIVEDFRDWPLDFIWKVGLERYFERGAQSDFWGQSVSVKAYWKRFPWDRWVRTRFGFSEGLSYAWHVPRVERVKQRERDRNTHRLLNYLDVSIDLNAGDLVRSKAFERCWLGFSVWHRSGAFGAVDIFGEVLGGSNYNTGYLECTF